MFDQIESALTALGYDTEPFPEYLNVYPSAVNYYPADGERAVGEPGLFVVNPDGPGLFAVRYFPSNGGDNPVLGRGLSANGAVTVLTGADAVVRSVCRFNPRP